MEKQFKPRFEMVYRPNPIDPDEKKWYASAVTNGLVNTDTLSQQIAARCTVTRHDVKACLSALQELIGEYIQMGCAVKLDDIGIFTLKVKSNGTATADDFVKENIHNTMLRFLPSDGMKTLVKNLTAEWTANGVSDGKKSQEQWKKEHPGA